MSLLKRYANGALRTYETITRGKSSALPFGAPFPTTTSLERVSTTPCDDPGGVIIVMAHTRDVDCYGKLSAEINKIYSDRHGYRFKLVVGPPLTSDRWVTWDKIKHLRDALDDQGVKWAFWIDSDAIFNTQRTSLQKFMIQSADLCVCEDIPWRLGTNTGTILVRNTQWAREFLETWWKRAETSPFANVKAHEQSELDRMVTEDVMGCRTSHMIAVLPGVAFNGAHWMPNPHERFVLHYMATSKEFRLEVLGNRLLSMKILENILK